MAGVRCNGRAFCSGRRPGFAPAGEALFFVSPKKSTPKKGDPTGCVPSLRCGQPAVLAPSGVLLKLAFGSDSRKPLSAGRCAPRRSQTGGGVKARKSKPGIRKLQQPTTKQPCRPTRPPAGTIPPLPLHPKRPTVQVHCYDFPRSLPCHPPSHPTGAPHGPHGLHPQTVH